MQMNRAIRAAIFLSILLIVQLAVVNNLRIGAQTANLLLMYVIYFAQKEGKSSGLLMGLILGLMIDMMLSNSIGIRALSFSVVAYVVAIISEYLFLENSFVLSFFAVFGTIMNKLILNLVYFFQSYDISFSKVIGNTFNFEIVLNIGVIIAIYYLEKRFKNYELFDYRKVELF